MSKKTKNEGPRRGFTLDPDSIGKIVDAESIPMQRKRVSQKYVPIINKVLGMKAGNAFALEVPKDTTPKKFMTAIATTLRKRLNDQLPKGTKLRFGLSQDGRLVVSLAKV